MRNPGDCGFDYGNNHTHLHKFRGHRYLSTIRSACSRAATPTEASAVST